jgi:uncharacterized protein (DUF2267 family)
MNLFEKIDQQAMTWVKEMMAELHTRDPHRALHALRAGLQALRDRLPLEEVAQLSAQLPLMVRGMFFENWVPTGKPLRLRTRREFLALVREKYGPREDVPAEDIVVALFRVLDRHVTRGEIGDVMVSLPEEILEVVAPRESQS